MKKSLIVLSLLGLSSPVLAQTSESICNTLQAPIVCLNNKITAQIGTQAGTLADGGTLAAAMAELSVLNTTASTAANNASTALTNANNAQTLATSAQTAATSAQTAANTALTTSQTAIANSTSALNSSQGATSVANAAQTTANTALTNGPYSDKIFGVAVASGSSSLATATVITHQFTELTSQGTGGSITLAAFDKPYVIVNHTGSGLQFWPPSSAQFVTASGVQGVGASVTIYQGSSVTLIPESSTEALVQG
jgi:hypothetical protein